MPYMGKINQSARAESHEKMSLSEHYQEYPVPREEERESEKGHRYTQMSL